MTYAEYLTRAGFPARWKYGGLDVDVNGDTYAITGTEEDPRLADVFSPSLVGHIDDTEGVWCDNAAAAVACLALHESTGLTRAASRRIWQGVQRRLGLTS